MPNVALKVSAKKKLPHENGTRVVDLTVVPSTTADIFRHPTMIGQSHYRHKVPQNIGV